MDKTEGFINWLSFQWDLKFSDGQKAIIKSKLDEYTQQVSREGSIEFYTWYIDCILNRKNNIPINSRYDEWIEYLTTKTNNNAS